jgi:hypothetical protein
MHQPKIKISIPIEKNTSIRIWFLSVFDLQITIFQNGLHRQQLIWWHWEWRDTCHI